MEAYVADTPHVHHRRARQKGRGERARLHNRYNRRYESNATIDYSSANPLGPSCSGVCLKADRSPRANWRFMQTYQPSRRAGISRSCSERVFWRSSVVDAIGSTNSRMRRSRRPSSRSPRSCQETTCPDCLHGRHRCLGTRDRATTTSLAALGWRSRRRCKSSRIARP